MAVVALRSRSAGEILDLAFQIYRRHWAALTGATAALMSPLLLLVAVSPLVALPLLNLFSNLFFMAASAAVVAIASRAYRGDVVDAIAAVQDVVRRFPAVWGAAIIQWVLIAIGLLLLIVPAILLAAWSFAMQQAVMIEGRSAGEAFGRSRALARGHLLHILLTSVLSFLIAMVAILGIGIASAFLPLGERSAAFLVTVAMIAINPIVAVVGTVLYYDLLIRNEALDVGLATERLAKAPGAGADAT